MIGFYNVSVILTYIGLASSVFGITRAMSGQLYVAILCLLISGVCDMFDGKIARATKRSRPAMDFGIQIDSLCDLVCFGVFPAVICWCAGVQSVIGIIVLILFVLAGVIRLGYFNVTEQQRQSETDESRKYYQGLPVTTIGLLLPLVFLFKNLFPGNSFSVFLTVFMIVVAFLNLLNFRLKKPAGKSIYVLVVIGLAVFVCVIVFLAKGIV
ncbi:MAG: CDP-alcohol phosphatidyltransferase family protein [Oscillospiraceae bacterium]|nr:CDP-alcohol phosphatidyltransferase family protein [Oscillospiraceae bacterium]